MHAAYLLTCVAHCLLHVQLCVCAGKRPGKACGGKSAAAKAAGRLQGAVQADGDVQQRKPARGAAGKKALAATDAMAKKPGKKKKTLLDKLRQLRREHTWLDWVVVALCFVIATVLYIRFRRNQALPA